MKFTKQELKLIKEALNFRGDIYAMCYLPTRKEKAKDYYNLVTKISNTKDINPVRPLDKELIKKVIHEIKNPYSTEPDAYTQKQYKFIINSLESLLETDNEVPINFCNSCKQEIDWIGICHECYRNKIQSELQQ